MSIEDRGTLHDDKILLQVELFKIYITIDIKLLDSDQFKFSYFVRKRQNQACNSYRYAVLNKPKKVLG